MDWVLEFYTLQDRWSGCYTGDVTDQHQEKATWVEEQITSGGTVDWDVGKWVSKAPMNRAMNYVATLRIEQS